MSEFVGTWGFVKSSAYVEEAQRAAFDDLRLSGATMRCADIVETGQLVVLFKDERFLVDRSHFHVRPTPELVWGDRVRMKDKAIEGLVVEICWHYKRQRYFYHVTTLDGRQLKKRYFPEELEKL